MSLKIYYSRAGHLIRRLNQIAVAIFLEETSALGLTTVQYSALRMISEVPGIDQASLSNMIAFDKTTIVKVVDRLVEKGLITRTRSQTDRRTNHLNVTPRGRQVAEAIEPMIDRCEQRILAPLGRADQKKFMEVITQLVHVNNIYSRAPLDDELLEKLAKPARAVEEAQERPARRRQKKK
jgi:DNA-binding MarR family transcriptional regulator